MIFLPKLQFVNYLYFPSQGTFHPALGRLQALRLQDLRLPGTEFPFLTGKLQTCPCKERRRIRHSVSIPHR